MSIVINAKRAARDHGLYNGETDSLNWEPSHVIMWNRLCNTFGGYFTREPSRLYQTPSFLEFLDKYNDSEYTKNNDSKAEKDEPVKLPHGGGADLRGLIPPQQPVNTEGAATKKEVAERNKQVNENVVTLPESMVPPKQASAKKASENDGVAKEKDSNKTTDSPVKLENKANNNSDNKLKSETEEKLDTGTETSKSGTEIDSTVSPKATQTITKETEFKPKSGNDEGRVKINPNAVKVR